MTKKYVYFVSYNCSFNTIRDYFPASMIVEVPLKVEHGNGVRQLEFHVKHEMEVIYKKTNSLICINNFILLREEDAE